MTVPPGFYDRPVTLTIRAGRVVRLGFWSFAAALLIFLSLGAGVAIASAWMASWLVGGGAMTVSDVALLIGVWVLGAVGVSLAVAVLVGPVMLVQSVIWPWLAEILRENGVKGV
jgi:hypothetical protein